METADDLSTRLVEAERELACLQFEKNRECVRSACPLYEDRHRVKTPIRACPVQSKGEIHGAASASGS